MHVCVCVIFVCLCRQMWQGWAEACFAALGLGEIDACSTAAVLLRKTGQLITVDQPPLIGMKLLYFRLIWIWLSRPILNLWEMEYGMRCWNQSWGIDPGHVTQTLCSHTITSKCKLESPADINMQVGGFWEETRNLEDMQTPHRKSDTGVEPRSLSQDTRTTNNSLTFTHNSH